MEDKNGKTALWHAIHANLSAAVSVLLELGAVWKFDEPCLHAALGKSDAMDAIISHYEKHAPEKLQHLFTESSTPVLRAALLSQDKNCAKLLLQRGAPFDIDSLGLAARFQNRLASFMLVEMLLTLGADPSLPDNNGRLPHTYTSHPDVKETLAAKAGVAVPSPATVDFSVRKPKLPAKKASAQVAEGFSFDSNASGSSVFGFNIAPIAMPAAPVLPATPAPPKMSAWKNLPYLASIQQPNFQLGPAPTLAAESHPEQPTYSPASDLPTETEARVFNSPINSPMSFSSTSSPTPASSTSSTSTATPPASAAPQPFQFNFSATDIKFDNVKLDTDQRFQPKFFMYKERK
eukprot:TRINITY_DN10171_c0_g1_i1.p1 TRINITY_DN10171_c0_g1~~TRINITY_DN10171_c0_g1_i1.p1  ORF type:complete len:397 (-),score=75.60 TRINITY_DN10171_c0_g1_i1:81-1124(-)